MLRESGMEGVSEKRLRTMKARATSSAQTGGAASKVASKVRGVVEPSMPRRARSTIPAHVTPPSEDEQFERKLRGFVKTRMQKVRRATRVVEAD
jgi:siroheme synthase (precorrin-2 oxidase/ferrochelatase)